MFLPVDHCAQGSPLTPPMMPFSRTESTHRLFTAPCCLALRRCLTIAGCCWEGPMNQGTTVRPVLYAAKIFCCSTNPSTDPKRSETDLPGPYKTSSAAPAAPAAAAGGFSGDSSAIGQQTSGASDRALVRRLSRRRGSIATQVQMQPPRPPPSSAALPLPLAQALPAFHFSSFPGPSPSPQLTSPPLLWQSGTLNVTFTPNFSVPPATADTLIVRSSLLVPATLGTALSRRCGAAQLTAPPHHAPTAFAFCRQTKV